MRPSVQALWHSVDRCLFEVCASCNSGNNASCHAWPQPKMSLLAVVLFRTAAAYRCFERNLLSVEMKVPLQRL